MWADWGAEVSVLAKADYASIASARDEEKIVRIGALIEPSFDFFIDRQTVLSLEFVMTFGIGIDEFLGLRLNEPPKINERFDYIACNRTAGREATQNGPTADEGFVICVEVLRKLRANAFRKFGLIPDKFDEWSEACHSKPILSGNRLTLVDWILAPKCERSRICKPFDSRLFT